MDLKENEMYLFKVDDPRTGKSLYFKSRREAWRVSEDCSMKDPKRLLFNTDYLMPHIEDVRRRILT